MTREKSLFRALRRRQVRSSKRPRLSITPLEDRTVPALVWTNRGDTSDRFNEVFGTNAAIARGVVDAVLSQWNAVVTNYNRPSGGTDIKVTISMRAAGTGFGGGAAVADSDIDADGYPVSGTVTLARGNDTTGDGDGDGDGWFLDPTPNDHSEFTGGIVSGYTGQAQAGSPAAGVGDFFTVINNEITHVLGIASNANLRFHTPASGTVTDTGVADQAEGGGVGTYFVFDGPSITALMTSNNGGPGGQDRGRAVHTAGPDNGTANQPVAFNSAFRGTRQLQGLDDNGNALYEFGTRYIVSDVTALLLQDAYGYTINRPVSMPTFYAMLQADGTLLVRGATGTGGSADTITLSRSGGNLVVSVDVGNDAPGTGPNGDAGNLPAFVTQFSLASVNSISIQAGDGADTIVFDLSGGAFAPAGGISLDGGTGTDVLRVNSDTNFTLSNSQLSTANGLTVNLSRMDRAELTGGGSANSFNLGGWTGTAAIDGAGGTDTLVGPNITSLWTIDGTNAGNVNGAITFTAVENLTGGNSGDRFRFTTGTLSGNIDGAGGSDTLAGDNVGRTFTVTGPNAGTVSVILGGTFDRVENLYGGAGADRLVVQAAGSLAGSFDGLGGADTADLALLAGQQITVTGLGGTDGFDTTGGSAVGGGFRNLNVLVGSLADATDKLTGLDAAGTYTVAAGNAGDYTDDPSARSLDFFNVENLTGGAGADTLVVAAAGFLGGAFDGRGGYDTADLAALGAQAVVIADVGPTDGYDLTGVTAVAGGLRNLDYLIGSAAGGNRLTGRDVAATWDLSRVDGGQYRDTSARTLDFDQVENLTGGADDDRLVVGAGGSLAGEFDGRLGTDTADFAAVDAQSFEVAALGGLNGYDVTNVPLVAGDLKNVDALVGSTADATDSLTGLSTASTWTVDAADAGTYQDDAAARPLDFSQVENLYGGAAADLLTVLAGGALAGSFDGGAGRDTADLSALAAVQVVTVLGLGGTDGFNTTGGTPVTGGFQNLDRLIGGSAESATLGSSDRLVGQDADAVWQVKVGVDETFYQDAGSGRKLFFGGFEELFGGTAADDMTVDFSAGNPMPATGLTVDGQGGVDFLTAIGTADRDRFNVAPKVFKVNKAPIRHFNFERLTAEGGDGNDRFYSGAVKMPPSVKLIRFNAGTGNDLATVTPTVLAYFDLNGGDGIDKLKVIRGYARYLTPIPPRTAVDGTYFFANRKALKFTSFEIRDIGITQPQP